MFGYRNRVYPANIAMGYGYDGLIMFRLYVIGTSSIVWTTTVVSGQGVK